VTRSHPKTCFDGENEAFLAAGKEAEAAIVDTIAMQADAGRLTKGPFAAQMRFWDGF
jgi:hypothetical protein